MVDNANMIHNVILSSVLRAYALVTMLHKTVDLMQIATQGYTVNQILFGHLQQDAKFGVSHQFSINARMILIVHQNTSVGT
jgi:hypothetical protein